MTPLRLVKSKDEPYQVISDEVLLARFKMLLHVNTWRSEVAEIIVGEALDAAPDTTGWRSYDLLTDDEVKVEVKSSSGDDMRFDIRPRKEVWEPSMESREVLRRDLKPEPQRVADVYVFAILEGDDPLRVDHWTFLVLDRSVIDQECGAQKSIGIGPLRALVERFGREVTASGLEDAVDEAVE